MGFFEQFPYTNFHELNLDWLLDQMKKLGTAFDAFVSSNVLKYADPIAWSIGSQYEANTIVRNGEDVYLSKQAVPAGVAITNEDYWFQVGDLSTYALELETLRHQIAAADEGVNVLASQSYEAGALFWLNDYLSEASVNIAAGETFVNGTNYTRVTVDELLTRLKAAISENADDLAALTERVTTAEMDIVSAKEDIKSVISGYNAVFFGDSWTVGSGASPQSTQRFSTKLCNMLEMNEINLAIGASGFTRPGNLILTQIQNASLTSDQIARTKYVIITGGVNDIRHPEDTTITDFAAAVVTAANAASAKFPNAVILMAIVNTTKSGITDGYKYWMSNAINQLMANNVERVSVLDMRYITYLRPDAYASDDLHPNNYGHSLIASYMAANLLGGYIDISYYEAGSFTWETGITVAGTHMMYRNGIIEVTPGQITMTNAVTANTPTVIGHVSDQLKPLFNVYAPVVFGNAIAGVLGITTGGNIYLIGTRSLTQFYVTPFVYEC